MMGRGCWLAYHYHGAQTDLQYLSAMWFWREENHCKRIEGRTYQAVESCQGSAFFMWAEAFAPQLQRTGSARTKFSSHKCSNPMSSLTQ